MLSLSSLWYHQGQQCSKNSFIADVSWLVCLSPFDDQPTTNKPAELHLQLGSAAAQIGHMIIHYYKNNKTSRTVELLHGELIERRRGSADKAAAAASIFNSIEYNYSLEPCVLEIIK